MEEPLSLEQLPKAVNQVFKKLENIENILRSQTSNSDNEQILSVKEAAILLHLSVPTMYGLCQQKQIPFSKKGKRLYFSKFELIEWVQGGRNKTAEEILDQLKSDSTTNHGRARK